MEADDPLQVDLDALGFTAFGALALSISGIRFGAFGVRMPANRCFG